MPPVARITDLHSCPLQAPGVFKVPHVGGAIIGPGAPTVLIGGFPAALVGDTAVCVGPPDTIISGSNSVLIEGKAAARIGDMTAHGGEVTSGLPTVLINS